MTDFVLVCADTVTADVLHACMTRAFHEYIGGTFALPLAQWPLLLGRHGVDLPFSRVAMRDSAPVAFSLVAPRTEIGYWRLGTMGAIPAARGTGAAQVLLDDFIERAKGAGMQGVELECIAQNERALKLYRSRGFEAISPLYGYARAPIEGTKASSPIANEVPLEEAFAWLDAVALQRADLPLQVTARSLRALPIAPVALRRGDAVLIYSETNAETITVQSIVDTNASLADAQSLIEQLSARYPERRIHAPQLHRPDVGGDAFERAGFERLALHQFMMRRAV